MKKQNVAMDIAGMEKDKNKGGFILTVKWTPDN